MSLSRRLLLTGLLLVLALPGQADTGGRPAIVCSATAQAAGILNLTADSCPADVIDTVQTLLGPGALSTEQPPVVRLHTYLNADDTPMLLVRPLAGPALPSPMLSAHLTNSLGFTQPIVTPTARRAAGWLVAGLLAYHAGECTTALPLFAASPPVQDQDHAFFQGTCRLLARDYGGAIQVYSRAQSGDRFRYTVGVDGPLLTNMAWLFVQKNNIEAVASATNTLLARVLDHDTLPHIFRPAAYQASAEAMALMNRHDAAIRDINQALRWRPNDPALYTLRGQMRLYLYEWDAALNDYNAAILRDPRYAPAYHQRGVLYYSVLTDRTPRQAALADFRRYLELAPNGLYAADARAIIDTIEAEIDALNP
ncbi:MAG: tetratricopeptide repeat protein [Chloroflexota bacterium]